MKMWPGFYILNTSRDSLGLHLRSPRRLSLSQHPSCSPLVLEIARPAADQQITYIYQDHHMK
jgi:hypothetical protein